MIFYKEYDNIVIKDTSPDDLDVICHLERSENNGQFILPYEKDRHEEVINSHDELHLSMFEKDTKDLIGFAILAGLTDPSSALEMRRIVIRKQGRGYGRFF
ncbi:MAG TPA: hypothetical protein VF691_18115 [Cytophagaceae bacterium]|jgi:hypothetical protein